VRTWGILIAPYPRTGRRKRCEGCYPEEPNTNQEPRHQDIGALPLAADKERVLGIDAADELSFAWLFQLSRAPFALQSTAAASMPNPSAASNTAMFATADLTESRSCQASGHRTRARRFAE
jgi:hypothetical protein